jgi:CRP-like cAMP-binding protein
MERIYLEILARTDLFQGIDIKNIEHILGCLDARVVHFVKHEKIVKVNDKYDGIFVTLEGEASIINEYSSGNQLTLDVFHAGDLFGEAVAFCGAKTWPASAHALTDCTLMFLHPEKILTMCDRPCKFHKVILANMIRVIAQKACMLNRKVEYLTLKSINGKLSKYLLEQSGTQGALTFKLPMNKERLADYLNISRPSMSRELGKMRDDGIIEFYRDSVKIIDVPRLRALLEQ